MKILFYYIEPWLSCILASRKRDEAMLLAKVTTSDMATDRPLQKAASLKFQDRTEVMKDSPFSGGHTCAMLLNQVQLIYEKVEVRQRKKRKTK